MGLVTGALQIGRSALLAYQSALQVVGNNVSNAGSANYTRQTPELSGLIGANLPEGFMAGGGVALTALRRNVDASLENRLRIATGDQAGALAEEATLSRIESVMNELSDSDLSSLLQNFFNSFSTLQNTPHDTAARGMVITAADSLIREIQRQRVDVLGMRDELNTQLQNDAEGVDLLSRQVADLNVRITALESSSKGSSGSLRDQRDDLLRQMSEIVQIQVRDQPDGSVNVYIGNELFISGGISRGMTTTLETTDNEPRVVVRFADNMREVSLIGGEMAGLVEARDGDLLGHVQALNSLSQALIHEVNKVHASGQGIRGYTDLTGAFDVSDLDAALNSAEANLDLTPQNGTFILYVTDTNTDPATRVATTIEVDLDGIGADDSLRTLAGKIDAAANVRAEATADGRLRIIADDGYEVTFGEDTSSVLAALGVNVFFTGSNSEDLSVNADLADDSSLLAAATHHAVGDGGNAASIAELASKSLSGLRGQSMTEFFNAIASDVATRSNAAQAGVKSANTIVSSLTAQRESISGVSLDEEAIAMLRFERAFQAAARYTTVVDQMIQETLAIVS
ncbi:MAG TPA: flagellar hook-associated protein FlgK [Phycisphaerae bacterium]|nr:flagellar hook-associated protein FlgK [Phycisphaerae bacterium]HRY68830.1 flagellar hook-associated protein FlgK [Phycisphaerae bacterium]HSA27495.1 flagellar hook-associated protein FlgK [Phycisphaerae bacterium]